MATTSQEAPQQLRVVGAGLPRTGTTSLKGTLEQLLGGACYHMIELQQRADADAMRWAAALSADADGVVGALDGVLDNWVAAVDWPASIFWHELADAHPDALVILSHRDDSATWWASATDTVWEAMRQTQLAAQAPDAHDNARMIASFNQLMLDRSGFSHDLADEAAARRRYDEHHAQVIDTIAADRLLIWQPSDGFAPIAERLGLPVPDSAPVHANDRAEFVERLKRY